MENDTHRALFQLKLDLNLPSVDAVIQHCLPERAKRAVPMVRSR